MATTGLNFLVRRDQTGPRSGTETVFEFMELRLVYVAERTCIDRMGLIRFSRFYPFALFLLLDIQTGQFISSVEESVQNMGDNRQVSGES